MLNAIPRTQLVCGVWLATLTAVIASSVAMDARISTSLFLFVLTVAPAVIAVLMAAATPAPTVAEILHAVHAKDRR